MSSVIANPIPRNIKLATPFQAGIIQMKHRIIWVKEMVVDRQDDQLIQRISGQVVVVVMRFVFFTANQHVKCWVGVYRRQTIHLDFHRRSLRAIAAQIARCRDFVCAGDLCRTEGDRERVVPAGR